MALEHSTPHLGDIGDEGFEPRCDFAGTLHADDCTCGAVERC